MKIYDLVKRLLTDLPELRNSDKKLIWAVWAKKQLVQVRPNQPIALAKVMYMDYLNAPSSESITRARRKLQEQFPHLRATKPVEVRRRKKQATKGTFVYKEIA